jgi:hypothetical protein
LESWQGEVGCYYVLEQLRVIAVLWMCCQGGLDEFKLFRE